MLKVVVCDDDATVRSVVADLASDVGLEVVAETDRGGDVLELVQRFDIDLVVLDLSMGSVSGNTVIKSLREQALDPTVIVFSSYVSDAGDLRADGVEHVVEKPDFEGLRAALLTATAARAANAGGTGGEAAERRTTSRSVAEAVPAWRSPSGLESEHAIRERLAGCQHGDSVLAVAVLGDDEHVASTHGALLAADWRLEPGRALRRACRTQDHVLVEPACNGYVALLRGSDERAPGSVWRRVEGHLERLPASPELAGAWVRVSAAVDATEARARAVGAAASARQPGLSRA